MHFVTLSPEEVSSLGTKMSKYKFQTLLINGKKSYSRVCIKENKRIQFKVVSKEIFSMWKVDPKFSYLKNGNDEFLYIKEVSDFCEDKGVLLSAIGMYSPISLEVSIDYDLIKKMNSAYQGGLSRKRCDKIGLATYRVARGTSRPNPRPTVKEDEVSKHQYFNQNLNQAPIVQLETESIAKRLGSSAIAFGEREHQPLFDIVGHSCDLIILTSGVTNETVLPVFSENRIRVKQNRQSFLSFSCTSHRDECDILSGCCRLHFESKCTENKYLQNMISMIGCGMPTTCQYKHVWVSPVEQLRYKVHAYFQHDDLGLVHEIVDRCSCTFLGFAYAHSTPICYLEKIGGSIHDEDGIIFMNDPDIFFMFAWGNSGGPAEYKRNNNLVSLTLTLLTFLMNCYLFTMKIFL